MDLKERYNRQLILPEIGEEGQARLQQARVLIVGVGGLGSPIALYLTGAGVGTIGLIDDDVVSESNLQRQVLYNEKEVGLSKAEKAREHLQALNSHVCIKAYPERLTAENAEAIIGQYDLVLDGCDNFATRYLINDTCVRLGKVYIYMVPSVPSTDKFLSSTIREAQTTAAFFPMKKRCTACLIHPKVYWV